MDGWEGFLVEETSKLNLNSQGWVSKKIGEGVEGLFQNKG